MDDRLTRGQRGAAVWLVVAIGGMAGCDKLSSGASGKPAASSATQAAAAAFPPRPLVNPSEMVAKANDKVLSVKDVELALQDLEATTRALGREWKPLPAEQTEQYDLHDLLDELIVAELRSQDALQRGLDRNTDVQYRFLNRYRNFFAQEWVNWQLERANVTEAEVEQFYNDNKAGFREPERIRVRQLIFSSESQAKSALVQLLEGTDVATVAQQSLRPEAATGELVNKWVMRSADKAAFAPDDANIRDLMELERVAFAIDRIGGTSSYTRGADGNYHIFQLVERQEGKARNLVDVADNIRTFLRLQKLNALTEEIQKKAAVERFAERLTNVKQ